MPPHVDLSGQVIRGIRVLSVASIHPTRREYSYRCECHCGREFTASVSALRNPLVKGCGCGQEARKHGLVATPEYGIWAAMKRRCLSPNNPAYHDYGGRGITVCDRWLDFKMFIADMDARPSPKHSIDRINNDGNYEPGNVRWATMTEQSFNRRNNVRPKKCLTCGKDFKYRARKQVFCSYRCKGLAFRGRSRSHRVCIQSPNH